MVLQLGQFGCVAGLHAVCLPTSARDQRTYAQSHSEPNGDATANSDTNPCSESHAAAVANANGYTNASPTSTPLRHQRRPRLPRRDRGIRPGRVPLKGQNRERLLAVATGSAIPVGSGVTVVDRRFRGFNVPVDQRTEFVGVPVFSCGPPGLESWIRHGVGEGSAHILAITAYRAFHLRRRDKDCRQIARNVPSARQTSASTRRPTRRTIAEHESKARLARGSRQDFYSNRSSASSKRAGECVHSSHWLDQRF